MRSGNCGAVSTGLSTSMAMACSAAADVSILTSVLEKRDFFLGAAVAFRGIGASLVDGRAAGKAAGTSSSAIPNPMPMSSPPPPMDASRSTPADHKGIGLTSSYVMRRGVGATFGPEGASFAKPRPPPRSTDARSFGAAPLPNPSINDSNASSCFTAATGFLGGFFSPSPPRNWVIFVVWRSSPSALASLSFRAFRTASFDRAWTTPRCLGAACSRPSASSSPKCSSPSSKYPSPSSSTTKSSFWRRFRTKSAYSCSVTCSYTSFSSFASHWSDLAAPPSLAARSAARTASRDCFLVPVRRARSILGRFLLLCYEISLSSSSSQPRGVQFCAQRPLERRSPRAR
mmetsp:Transcript_11658/g.30446  ORF Transcript_11658/g.30446 Transcript_11658/m.30446 type:complete len:344 (+) Transcript_11658:3780-4811(+)